MGTSTDGILAYGYDLGGPAEGWKIRFAGIDGEYKNPDWYDREEGFPDSAMKLLLAAVGFVEEWTPGSVGFFERRGEAEAAVGVHVARHCSGDYPMYLLAAKVARARRGCPIEVDFSLPDNADERLAWAVEVLGLDVGDQKLQWLLASYWG